MRLALLASAESIHTVRWANALADRGLAVDLLSLHAPSSQLASSVRCHRLPFAPPHGYLLAAPALHRLLRRLRPDVLHTHYAGGYGTLGRLAHFRPQVLSVWGSDVFDVPNRSALHRQVIVRNLRRAEIVCSISRVMAERVKQLTAGAVCPAIVPWGVETTRFAPVVPDSEQAEIVIGTVKSLRPKYGIDTLLGGFARCRSRLQAENRSFADRLRLRIVGEGPQRQELVQLAATLGIAEVTDFVGPVEHCGVPSELNRLDVYVAVSRMDSESFGVAVIEASACGRPVVVSDAGGLPEVVVDGQTGIVVPRENPERLADALVELVEREDLRRELGGRGRLHVQAHYEWNDCVDEMIAVYQKLLGQRISRHAA
jgi:L-malate glycosyltransferase